MPFKFEDNPFLKNKKDTLKVYVDFKITDEIFDKIKKYHVKTSLKHYIYTEEGLSLIHI